MKHKLNHTQAFLRLFSVIALLGASGCSIQPVKEEKENGIPYTFDSFKTMIAYPSSSPNEEQKNASIDEHCLILKCLQNYTLDVSKQIVDLLLKDSQNENKYLDEVIPLKLDDTLNLPRRLNRKYAHLTEEQKAHVLKNLNCIKSNIYTEMSDMRLKEALSFLTNLQNGFKQMEEKITKKHLHLTLRAFVFKNEGKEYSS